MGETISELEMDGEDYEDFRNIVIELDEKMVKFMTSFNIGSLLSLEVLVGLATKYDCEICSVVFYSNSLFIEHSSCHGFNPANIENAEEMENKGEIHFEDILGDDYKPNEPVTNAIKEETQAMHFNFINIANEENTLEEMENEKIGHKDRYETESMSDGQETEPMEANKEEILQFNCDICDKLFSKQSCLVRHRFTHRKCDQDEYSCFHCKRVYKTKRAKYLYTRHIDRLIASEKRICDTCGYMAKTNNFLEDHKQVKHMGVKRFKCDTQGCDKRFSKNMYLTLHRKTHNKSTTLQCNECSFTTHLKKNLTTHTKRQHLDKRTLNLNCSECEYFAPNKDQLQRHKRINHSDNPNKCSQCDKTYLDRGKYLLHIKIVHEGVRYRCETCELKFTSKNTLVTHTKRVHEGLKMKCKECEHEATSQRALRWHVLKIHETNPFSCDLCTFVGSSYPILNGHKNKVHIGVQYQCNLCDHILYDEILMRDHTKQNHPDQHPIVNEHKKTTFNVEDLPKCEPCNRLFKNRQRYLAHNKQRHGANGSSTNTKSKRKNMKNEICLTCCKSFFTDRRLERHMILYHPTCLQCTKCDEAFIDKALFIEHKNKHRQDNLFQCSECKQLLRSESRLERHVYLDHSSILQCPTCGESFTDKNSFIFHEKSHNKLHSAEIRQYDHL